MSKKSSLEAKIVASPSTATETTPLVPKGDLQTGEDPSGKSENGLTPIKATMLVTGQMAGSGVLALPRALVRTGWVGVPIIILMGAMAAFSGKRLADCWLLLEERNPDMRTRKRNPYSIIADQALGKTWSVVVSMAILVTLFGASLVYLLMAAQIVEGIVLSLLPRVTYCIWFLIVTGAVSPLLFFNTPRNFVYTGIITFGAAIVACILYFIQMMSEIRPFVFRLGVHGFQEFFLAIGTMMFAFGGTATIPTIQNDTTDKTKFNKVLQYGYVAIIGLYLTMAITGYAIYGESVSANLATSLSPTPLTLVGNIFMVIHLITAFVILINPVFQEMEELYEVPRDSVAGRIGVRTSIILALMFIGESIPRFQTILALVGGTSIAILTIILPPLCYMMLTKNTGTGQTATVPPTWMKVISWNVISAGVIGGVIAAVCAISAMFITSQAKPCYL